MRLRERRAAHKKGREGNNSLTSNEANAAVFIRFPGTSYSTVEIFERSQGYSPIVAWRGVVWRGTV